MLDNLDEMNKFLETYNLAKLNQEESENLNKQITPNKIEAVIKKCPIIIKALDQMVSQVILPMVPGRTNISPSHYFKKCKRRESCPSHFTRQALS